ncbi:MAG TPA: TlpA disulfide reductase family protein [Kofleriaceae bacterium]|nr:TlpA disulfide reductase family protein [Kofleriaceae bacterium]
MLSLPLKPLLAALALGLLLAAPSADAGVRTGERAAELIGVKDTRGRAVNLKAYRGKWVVLTFGASWCKPCKKELPAYEKLARKLEAAGKPVVFIAVNIDSDKKAGKKFMKQAGLKVVRAGYDPAASSAKLYDPPTTPSTFVIGPRGIVRKLHEGFRGGDEHALERYLNEQLAKK